MPRAMSASSGGDSTPNSRSRGFLAYLMLTALLCGAFIMVIEVLGSRVIGPFFGVSLFVWTSLIAVTLIALALGYALGGLWADRNGSPDYLYAVILIAGILVLLIPLIKAPVLKGCLPFGLRGGAFASTLILFGPCLFCLGCVSPYLVKVSARELKSIGRTVGGLYALSTVGSVAGTLLTGFFLIAHMGVDRIFQVSGGALIALSICYFAAWRRTWWVSAFVVLPFVAPLPGPVTAKVMANGTRVEVVAAEDSFYGHVKVVDYSYGPRHTRELIIDGLVQGGIDVRSGLSIYAYAYLLQFVPFAMNSDGHRALALGLGAGIIPMWFESRGIVTDVVDIDPVIVRFARQYFGFASTGDVLVEDARFFLQNTTRTYDYVVMDVFNGDVTPSHLMSIEVFEAIENRMNEGGILAINMAGSVGRDAFATGSVVRTLQRVFDWVEVYPMYDQRRQRCGNLAIFAYDAASRRAPPGIIRFPVHAMVSAKVARYLRAPLAFSVPSRSIVLTDDYNPMDVHNAPLKECVRHSILEDTDWDVLIDRG